MSQLENFLPNQTHWQNFIGEKHEVIIHHLLEKNLLLPLQDFFQRPGKNLRSVVVELGHRLNSEHEDGMYPEDIQRKIELAGTIVEFIHAGSLIIDDIQDGSQVRRNAPTLHLVHGMPLALNAGNWLYFWALSKVKDLELSSEATNTLTNDLLKFMIKAHMGQAIDLGTPINEISTDKIPEVSRTSMQLKTGVLLTFALRLGSAISSDKWKEKEMTDLGKDLGRVLQIYDDFASLAAPRSDHPSKRHEDLVLKRPSWVWSEASLLGDKAFDEFKLAVKTLPDETLLESWLKDHEFISHLWERIHAEVLPIKERWKTTWNHSHPQTLKKLLNLCQQLENSYVKKH